MNFTKMHGTGNDFIFILDLNDEIKSKENLAKKLCHRRFGIGADGLILVKNSNVSDMKMEIINSDGSHANMCGNAIRCFGKYIYEKNLVSKSEINVETGDGIKTLHLEINENNIVESIKVYMGEVSFDGRLIPLRNKEKLIDEVIEINNKEYRATSILVGVPHTVIFNNDNKYTVDEGKYIEKHSLFLEGTNVNFVKVIDDENIEVNTWERGAGYTYSCGTGCSASVVAANHLGFTKEKVNVNVPGGRLRIEIEDRAIYMIGNAEFICEGISMLNEEGN